LAFLGLVCFFLRCSDGYVLVNVLSAFYDVLMDDSYLLICL
jgi:hypothetical protein